MQYFCYVSEEKIRNISSTIQKYDIESITEDKILSKDKNYNMGFGDILQLLKLGANFDKKERTGSSVIKKPNELFHLKELINKIILSEKVVNLNKEVPNNFDRNLCTYFGRFKVLRFDKNIAILSSQMEHYTLKMACSLKYFSDMGISINGEYFPHSGNYFFFNGDIEPLFSTLFLYQDRKENEIMGSPIYLAMTPTENLKILL